MKALWTYITDHWSIFLFGALAAVAFLYSERFAEFLYGILRFAVVVLVGLAVRDLLFKGTVRPYINSGLLQNDFRVLPPVHKVWITVVIIVALLSLAAACLIHP